jgi:hypothetical protein
MQPAVGSRQSNVQVSATQPAVAGFVPAHRVGATQAGVAGFGAAHQAAARPRPNLHTAHQGHMPVNSHVVPAALFSASAVRLHAQPDLHAGSSRGALAEADLVSKLCSQIRGAAPPATTAVFPSKPTMKLNVNAIEFAPRGQMLPCSPAHGTSAAGPGTDSVHAPAMESQAPAIDVNSMDPISKVLMAMVQQIGPLSDKDQALVAKCRQVG